MAPPDSPLLQLGSCTVRPLPERALWLPERRTLLVADLHWGKDHTFRTHGIPLPDGMLADDLQRLDGLVAQHDAERIIVLGDLVHHASGLTPGLHATIGEWRRRTPVRLTLVRGNHDRHLLRVPAEWQLDEEAAGLSFDGLTLVHDPDEARTLSSTGYAVAGHLHPTVVLARRGDRMRLPCFHFGRRLAVLPAFSTFTNGLPIVREAGDRVMAIAGGQLIEV